VLSRLVYALLGIAALAGCGTPISQMQFTQDGVTDAQYKRDTYECERDARAVGPVVLTGGPIVVPGTSGIPALGNMPATPPTPAQVYPGSYSGVRVADRRFYQRCMEVRGYTRER
jgi:hypothetical protein